MCQHRILQLHIDFSLPNYAVHNLLFHPKHKNNTEKKKTLIKINLFYFPEFVIKKNTQEEEESSIRWHANAKSFLFTKVKIKCSSFFTFVHRKL